MVSPLWLVECAAQRSEQTSSAGALSTWREADVLGERGDAHDINTKKMVCFLQFLSFSFSPFEIENSGIIQYKHLDEMMIALRVRQ